MLAAEFILAEPKLRMPCEVTATSFGFCIVALPEKQENTPTVMLDAQLARPDFSEAAFGENQMVERIGISS